MGPFRFWFCRNIRQLFLNNAVSNFLTFSLKLTIFVRMLSSPCIMLANFRWGRFGSAPSSHGAVPVEAVSVEAVSVTWIVSWGRSGWGRSGWGRFGWGRFGVGPFWPGFVPGIQSTSKVKAKRGSGSTIHISCNMLIWFIKWQLWQS